MAQIRTPDLGAADESSRGVGAMALVGTLLAVFGFVSSQLLPGAPWGLLFPILLGAGLGLTRGLLGGTLNRALGGLAIGSIAGGFVGSGLVGNLLLACGLFGGLLGADRLFVERNPRLLASAVITTGLLAASGAAVASIVLAAPVLPELASVALAGAAFGLSIGTSEVLRMRPRDLLLRSYYRLRDATRGDLAQMLEALVRELLKLEGLLNRPGRLPLLERQALVQNLHRLTERVLDTAERQARLEHELSRVRPPEIEQREREVSRRLSATQDEHVRQQYSEALEALHAQRRHYLELEAARERLLSRLTNALASMQSLYLSLVHLDLAEGEAEFGGSQEPGSLLRHAGDEVETLRRLADEMSLRYRLDSLPDEPRALTPSPEPRSSAG